MREERQYVEKLQRFIGVKAGSNPAALFGTKPLKSECDVSQGMTACNKASVSKDKTQKLVASGKTTIKTR